MYSRHSIYWEERVENVLANAPDCTHVQPLSETCMLQLNISMLSIHIQNNRKVKHITC